MFYAILDQAGETLKARFYNREDRDEFCGDRGAKPVKSRSAKFVAGADRNVTFSGKAKDGTWLPL